MRKFVIALALSSALATPAMAEPFSGPYVGIEAGLDNYEVQAEDIAEDGDQVDGLSANGVVGGVFTGYDIALGNAFVGVEGKASLSDAGASYESSVASVSVRAKESFGATVRAGVMINDSTGLYARAGWANTKVKVAVDDTTESATDDALVLGAGLQTRLGASSSLRVEYVRTDYNDFIKNNAVLAGVAFHF